MKLIMNDKNGLVVFTLCFILLWSLIPFSYAQIPIAHSAKYLLVPKTVVEMTEIKDDTEVLLDIKNINGMRVLEYSINLRNQE